MTRMQYLFAGLIALCLLPVLGTLDDAAQDLPRTVELREPAEITSSPLSETRHLYR